jgi:hypothetical protein
VNGTQFRVRHPPFTVKYICLGYSDPAAFAAIPEATREAMMDNRFAYDEQLRANGHYKGGEGLQPSGG